MTRDAQYTILVDGYNVAKQHPQWRSLSPARARQQLAAAIQHAKWPVPVARVELVFDGDPTVAPTGRRAGPVSEVFGLPSADSAIVGRVQRCASPDRMIVVTDDREIVRAARVAGARVESTAWLLGRLNAGAASIRRPAARGETPPTLTPGQQQRINDELARRWKLRPEDHAP